MNMSWVCGFVVSYDEECADGKDKFEGITNLVEHPIQMKPPGQFCCCVILCK